MLEKLRVWWDIFVSELSAPVTSKKISLVVLTAIVAVIPATVLVAQQQQTIFTRAAEVVTPPSPTNNTVNWTAEHALLKADDFYIIANGKKYLANTSNLRVRSPAPSPIDFKSTSLEAEWTENGVDMRMYIYFTQENNKWKVSEIRTYNGNVSGDWIYYQGFEDQVFEGNSIGSPFIKPLLELTSIQNPYNPNNTDKGSIYFVNMTLQPFLVQIPPTGYYIYRTPESSIVMPVSQPDTGYDAAAILFKDGVVLKNQANFIYSWNISDNTIASISPFEDCYVDLLQPPCPQVRVGIKGLKAGSTIINLDVKDTATQTVVASTLFNLTVSPPLPTPTPTSVPLPDLVIDDIFQGGKEPGTSSDHVYVRYRNIQASGSGKFFIKFSTPEATVNPTLGFPVPTPNESMRTRGVNISKLGLSPGETQAITAQIDSGNNIQESNEANNTLSRTVTIIFPTVSITTPISGYTVPSSGFRFAGLAQANPSTLSIFEVRVRVYDVSKATLTVSGARATYNSSTKEWFFDVLPTAITPGSQAELRVRAKDNLGYWSLWSKKTVVNISSLGPTPTPTPAGSYTYPTPGSYGTPYLTPTYGTPSYGTPAYSTPSTYGTPGYGTPYNTP